jgi:hypothetical protein
MTRNITLTTLKLAAYERWRVWKLGLGRSSSSTLRCLNLTLYKCLSFFSSNSLLMRCLVAADESMK